jgi:hypothetical protein
MVESMVAIVLLDALLQHRAQCQLFPINEMFGEGSELKASMNLNPLGKKLQGFGEGLI